MYNYMQKLGCGTGLVYKIKTYIVKYKLWSQVDTEICKNNYKVSDQHLI